MLNTNATEISGAQCNVSFSRTPSVRSRVRRDAYSVVFRSLLAKILPDIHEIHNKIYTINPLVPNDVYIRLTAQLTSRRCILNIYSTYILNDILTMLHILRFFFSSRCLLFNNTIFFGSCNIHILNTGCA